MGRGRGVAGTHARGRRGPRGQCSASRASLGEKPRPPPVATATRRDARAAGMRRHRPGRRAGPASSPGSPGRRCALAALAGRRRAAGYPHWLLPPSALLPPDPARVRPLSHQLQGQCPATSTSQMGGHFLAALLGGPAHGPCDVLAWFPGLRSPVSHARSRRVSLGPLFSRRC